MGIHNGKFYDAEYTRRFFADLESAFGEFKANANLHKDSLNCFATTEAWHGEDAVAGKKLTGTYETQIVDDMMQLQMDIIALGNAIMEKFAVEVDSDYRARMDYDTLENIDKDFKDLYDRFDGTARCSESKVSSLQSRFNRYGLISTPDFSEGRNALVTFCGGNTANDGFMHECMDKLVRFDSEVMGMLEAANLISKSESYGKKLEVRSSGVKDEGAVRSSKDGSEMFDEDGGYGGNQMSPYDKAGFLFFGHNFFYNKELYSYIRKHKGYENYTNAQIYNMLKELEEEGCGFVAAVNSIFGAYEGRAEEFEEAFGIPMYDKNGDLNFNLLLVDYYMATDNKFFCGKKDSLGQEAATYGILSHYSVNGETDKKVIEARQKEFKDKYGVDLYADSSHTRFSTKAYEKVMEDVAASGKEIDVETRGTSTYAMQNRLTHYLNSHGVSNSDVREMDELSDKSIKKQLNKGNTVVIYADNFKLYNEKGKAVFSDRIGAHGMTVTDVNDDGTYTVSSWGEKYYYKPDGGEYGDEPFTYVVINVDTTDD